MMYDLEALVSRLTALESKHMDLLEAYGLLVNAYEQASEFINDNDLSEPFTQWKNSNEDRS